MGWEVEFRKGGVGGLQRRAVRRGQGGGDCTGSREGCAMTWWRRREHRRAMGKCGQCEQRTGDGGGGRGEAEEMG